MARFYLTTAIDYGNSRPHLGTAYEKVAADVIARYRRLRGADTGFSWEMMNTRRTYTDAAVNSA